MISRRLEKRSLCMMALLAMAIAQLSAQVAPPAADSPALAAPDIAVPPARERMRAVDAWTAVGKMTPGINIGNTLENTAQWETGWGNPPITRPYVQSLARLGFKTVRLPVAWDTYAKDGRITSRQFQRVSEVVNWITDAGMYCVLNIHWDGGWIDSDVKERYPQTHHTFSPEAEAKFRSYWEQISRFFAGKNEKLIFEAFNEESTFSDEGLKEKASCIRWTASVYEAALKRKMVPVLWDTGGAVSRREPYAPAGK